MRNKKILVVGIFLLAILAIIIISSFNKKDSLKLSTFQEFKSEMMKEYCEIDDMNLTYWHIGVKLIINTTNEISYNKQISIYNDSRNYLIDNYNEIDDIFIKKNKFCTRLSIGISPKDTEKKGTYINSNYYTMKEKKLDAFKTWYYNELSTYTSSPIYYDEGVERIYPSYEEERRKREGFD